jgi:hypothetical protein
MESAMTYIFQGDSRSAYQFQHGIESRQQQLRIQLMRLQDDIRDQ